VAICREYAEKFLEVTKEQRERPDRYGCTKKTPTLQEKIELVLQKPSFFEVLEFSSYELDYIKGLAEFSNLQKSSTPCNHQEMKGGC